MKSVLTDTALRFQKIHKHQAVLIVTDTPGQPWRGIILSPGKSQSLVRFNQDGTLRERRLDNKRLFPVRIRPQTA